VNFAQAINPDRKLKQPQKQYPVYVPTLDEPWIRVRFIKAKPRPNAAIGNLVDICTRLAAALTDKPQPALVVSKEAFVTLEQGLNALSKMARDGLVSRMKVSKKWLYFRSPHEQFTE
jgi:hypothetical protein